jgi:predicted fused transcriptional regulator/phosphomethylpyrimidine kinase/predicted transcriptional regulator
MVQRNYLRVVRIFVARSLKDAGLSQTEIATKMDLTQAAVSKYLSAPLTNTKLAKDVKQLTQTITELILTGESGSDQIVREICSVCMKSRIGSTLCGMHQELVPSLKSENCQICSQLLGGRDDELRNRATVIGDMLDALKLIELSDSFEVIVPQVRANFVTCNEHAETYKDVAGVPGRITIVNGRARALISPQFGASQHTAEILLEAKNTWPRVRACLCVSGRDEVVKLAGKSGFRVLSLKEPESSASKIIRALKSSKHSLGPRTSFPAVHIPGGIGIEPILYLFGPSAIDVSERSTKLSDDISI